MDKPEGYWKTHEQLVEEVKQLQEEVEKWQSLASQIKTDWIPANQKLSDENQRLRDAITEAENMLTWSDIYSGLVQARDVLSEVLNEGRE